METMEIHETETQEGELTEGVQTQHEPHTHARPRLLVGVGAVLFLFIVGVIVWRYWGDEIKDACLGDGEVCTVELPDTPSQGGVDFSATYEE